MTLSGAASHLQTFSGRTPDDTDYVANSENNNNNIFKIKFKK